MSQLSVCIMLKVRTLPRNSGAFPWNLVLCNPWVMCIWRANTQTGGTDIACALTRQASIKSKQSRWTVLEAFTTILWAPIWKRPQCSRGLQIIYAFGQDNLATWPVEKHKWRWLAGDRGGEHSRCEKRNELMFTFILYPCDVVGETICANELKHA